MNILYCDCNNLGDLANIYIGLKYKYTHFKPFTCKEKQNNCIFIIGSILKFCGNNNVIVGAGFKDNTGEINLQNNKVYCVRGELSKKATNSNVFMIDPGLIIRKLYTPNTVQTNKKILIIPHYNHKEFFTTDCSEYDIFNIQFNKDDLNMIKTADYNSVDTRNKIIELFNNKFDIINSYDLVMSSSLHGLVFAHALGKKTIYFEISECKNEPNYKFNDYYSIYKMKVQPIKINKNHIPNIKYSDYISKHHSVHISKYDTLINQLHTNLQQILK